ncbi:MAG: hypothetical protein Q9170_005239 [Blastenia crenularia]
MEILLVFFSNENSYSNSPIYMPPVSSASAFSPSSAYENLPDPALDAAPTSPTDSSGSFYPVSAPRYKSPSGLSNRSTETELGDSRAAPLPSPPFAEPPTDLPSFDAVAASSALANALAPSRSFGALAA